MQEDRYLWVPHIILWCFRILSSKRHLLGVMIETNFDICPRCWQTARSELHKWLLLHTNIWGNITKSARLSLPENQQIVTVTPCGPKLDVLPRLTL